MNETRPIIELAGISKTFGGVKALDGVDLIVRHGEIHALAGENGSGKSTLIKIICGEHQPSAGTFSIEGKECRNITQIDAIRRGIQVIYQDFSIFPNLSVRENIAFNTEIMNHRKLVNKTRMSAIAKEAIERIGFRIDLDELVGNLSVANKQLVAISRALLHSAKLIIMDEPTTALTRKEVDKLFSIVKMLQNEQIAVLFVSHKTDEVFEISENYTILRNGQRVNTGKVEELTRELFAFYMTGREFVYENKGTRVEGKPVLETKELSKRGAYADISFGVREGEILCVAGLLGSGRTELAKTLCGLEWPDSGSILMDGRPIQLPNIQSAMAYNIGYVPEDRLSEGLFHIQSIFWNQAVSNLKHHTKSLGILDQQAMRDEVLHWAKNLSLNTMEIDRNVSTLSGGNQQKVILSRWLATKLRVLILNGPTVGVDIGVKFDIHRLLRELAQSSMSIIIISDDIPEILACSDRVLVMKDGRITGEYETAVTQEETLNRAMLAQQ